MFTNRSIDVLLTYGRLFMARRLALSATHDRFGPEPTRFGLSELNRLYRAHAEAEARYLS